MAHHPHRCPICDKPAKRDSEAYPFCSKRCQLIDLGNWASEEYVVPGKKTEADEHFELPDEDEAGGGAFRDE